MKPSQILAGFFRLYNVLQINQANRRVLAAKTPGSSPGGTTNNTLSYNGSTWAFEVQNGGSTPPRVTNNEQQRSGLSRVHWKHQHAGSNPAYSTKGPVVQWQDSPLSAGWLRVRVPSGPLKYNQVQLRWQSGAFGMLRPGDRDLPLRQKTSIEGNWMPT